MHAVILSAALATAASGQCPIQFATDAVRTTGVPDTDRTIAADFDGDGRNDLILLTRLAPVTVSILWGRGDGSFEAPVVVSGATGHGLAVGDLNEDGRPDLLFTPNSGSIALDVASFRPDRTFTLHPAAISRTGNVASLTIADLDADGHLDAAFATSSNTIGLRLARGDGAGGFTPGPFVGFTPPSGQRTQGLTAAAIRSPLTPDLIISTTGSGASRILTARFQDWDTPPTITDTRDLARSHTDIAAADFDSDGRDDLVLDTYNGSVGGISTFAGLPAGTLAAERFSQAGFGQPLAMAVGDLDGDHRPDVLTTNTTFTVFRNSGPDGLLPTLYDYTILGGRNASIADFDHDGRADVALTTSTGSFTADVVLNTGPLPPVRPVLDPIYTCPGQNVDARLSALRFIPISWQFLGQNGWTALPEGGTITTPTGEPFGTATNTDNTVLHIAVAQGCCFTSHTALLRGLASNVCGTTVGPPIHLTVCRADFTCDGFLDFFDYDGFVESFLAGDPSTDFNNDNFLDFFDYDDFVASFESGC